jgi:NAD(P)-dependent dehydrogenase (short-subunit alcohol dehydrogenase family)
MPPAAWREAQTAVGVAHAACNVVRLHSLLSMVISEEIDPSHLDSEAVCMIPVTSGLTRARPSGLKRKAPGTSSIRSRCHYCASKAAVVMLGRAMALELGAHSIRVNTVLPGYINVAEGGQRLPSSYRKRAPAPRHWDAPAPRRTWRGPCCCSPRRSPTMSVARPSSTGEHVPAWSVCGLLTKRAPFTLE